MSGLRKRKKYEAARDLADGSRMWITLLLSFSVVIFWADGKIAWAIIAGSVTILFFIFCYVFVAFFDLVEMHAVLLETQLFSAEMAMNEAINNGFLSNDPAMKQITRERLERLRDQAIKEDNRVQVPEI